MLKNLFKKKPKEVKPLGDKAPAVDEALLNPLDKAASGSEDRKGSDIVRGIVSTETSEGIEDILDAAPEVDTSLLQDVEPPKSLLLMILKILFVFFVVGGIASLLFFTSQLTMKFDVVASKVGAPNISKELTSTNSEILTLQRDLVFYRYLQTKAYLDKFSFYGDTYIQSFETMQSQTASSNDKDRAGEMLVTLRNDIRESYLMAKDKYIIPFDVTIFSLESGAEQDAEEELKTRIIALLSERVAGLSGNSNEEAVAEAKTFIHTKKLVGNNALKNLFIKTDIDDLSDRELYALIKELNAEIVNDLSIIQDVKKERIKWSDIINEIERRTIAVDSYYTDDFYNELGGIRYTSYDFDTQNKRISIAGETKRFDTTNFSMISNLIDELNSSLFFENAEMRSFSKSGSLKDGYVANLKLTLDLQDLSFTENDAGVDVKEFPNNK